MKVVLIALLLVHGLIHLIGVAKGFGFAEVDALQTPIGRGAAVLWLAAAIACVVAAILLLVAPGSWWVVGLPAVVLSQIAIVGAWSDAKFGTIANLLVAVPLAVAIAGQRSGSLSSRFARDVAALPAPTPAKIVTDRELERLPDPVSRWLRRIGVVGRPRVERIALRFTGALRSAPAAAWMPTRAVQEETFGPDAARLFFASGARFGLPFDAYHRFVGRAATMEVDVASLIRIVDARGPEMDQSETVTLFNDMCLLAPSTLIDADVDWIALDDRRVRAVYRRVGIAIAAELSFDDAGDLVDFRSNDRFQSVDGKQFAAHPWSTPVRRHAEFGGVRIAAEADAIWLLPEGPFVYGRFTIEALEERPAETSASSGFAYAR